MEEYTEVSLRNYTITAIAVLARHGLRARLLDTQKAYDRAVTNLGQSPANDEAELLWMKTAIIRMANLLQGRNPRWHEVSIVNLNPNFSPDGHQPRTWYAHQLYALLLTNSAVAYCMWRHHASGAASSAFSALNHFDQASHPSRDQWKAVALMVLAKGFLEEASAEAVRSGREYAQEAVQVLKNINPPVSLLAYAHYLAGGGVATTEKPGVFGSNLGRRQVPLSFEPDHLFYFQP